MATGYTLWNGKAATDQGNKKRDVFYLVLRGLDTVDFLEKDETACLESAVLGNMKLDGVYEDLTECATADKSIGYRGLGTNEHF